MASSPSIISSRRSASNGERSSSHTNDKSLPIRTAATPTLVRPIPATLPSSHSSSSTSSSESSGRIFDRYSIDLRAESPSTPPDDLMIPSPKINPRTNEDIEQDTPLLKVYRRPRRPPISPVTADPRKLQGNTNIVPRAHQASTRQLAPPPQLKPFGRRPKAVLRHHSPTPNISDASRSASLLPDIFASPQSPIYRSESEQLEFEDGEQEVGNKHDCEEAVIRGPESRDPPDSDQLKFKRYHERDRDVYSINESILKSMKNPREPKMYPGWTYIFESPNRAPGHFKIGHTKGMNDREKSLKKCEKEFILVEDEDRNAFDFHSIVESLVHQELQNQRRILDCECKKCGKHHKEWFEVNRDIALKSLKRWRTWIKVQKPYDKQWKLRPYWQWKVRNLPKTLDVDWDDWIKPTRWDYYRYLFLEGEYNLLLETHFKRKDKQFLQVGAWFLLFTYFLFGGPCSLWALVGLVVL